MVMTQQSMSRTKLADFVGVLQSLEAGGDAPVLVNGDVGVRIVVARYQDPTVGGIPHISLTGDNHTVDNYLTPLEHSILVDESQRQAILMALAHLAVERPGWDTMLRTIAKKMDGGECPVYSEFKKLHREKVVDLQSGIEEQGA
jgi:hypothetical protein